MKIINSETEPFHTLPFLQVDGMRRIIESELPFHRIYVDRLPDGLDAIVATADLQGRDKNGLLTGITVAEELELLSELNIIPSRNKTGVVLCGDFFTREKLDKRGGSGDVSDVWSSFAKLFRWSAGIAGNHDLFSPMPDTNALKRFINKPGIHFLDSDCTEKDNLRISGISGIMGNPGKPFRKTEDEFISILRNMIRKKPDILLLHDGPDIPEWNCMGNPIIRRELISVRHPMLVVRGHAHWDPLFGQLNEQLQVLNAHERVLVIMRS